MKPRDIFKIIVATIGVVGFSYGLIYLLDGILCAMGLFELQRTQPAYYAARGVVEMFVGVMFIKGVPPFVDMAFPLDNPPINQTDENKSNT